MSSGYGSGLGAPKPYVHFVQPPKANEIRGRGEFLRPFRDEQNEQSFSSTASAAPAASVGRGRLLSTLARAQNGAIPRETPVHIASTADALAQLRLKRQEDLARSSDSKGPSSAPAASVGRGRLLLTLARAQNGAIPKKTPVYIAPTSDALAQLHLKRQGDLARSSDSKGAPSLQRIEEEAALLDEEEALKQATKIGSKCVKLFSRMQLPDRVTQSNIKNQNDNSEVTTSLIYKERNPLYGILFANIVEVLKSKNLDQTEPKVIPQHKLKIWSDHVTAGQSGILLGVDATHRFNAHQTVVLDVIRHVYRSSRGNMDEFRDKVLRALLDRKVFTRYNNKTYRIDDIDFRKTPMDTFQTKAGPVSYVQYYKQQYDIEIKDLKQPLLINREEVRVPGQKGKVEFSVCILPEVCYLIGSTGEQRADFKVVRDVVTSLRSKL